ncbi:replication initiation negative regulator SeqA [Proteus hauseri]|uniref:Negative modulator of initiation of replication n=1 Tax=Proteus cibi TaxID=2050966 RepID=A0ABU6ED39_9GAMM|nr:MULTISPECIES: replication initiation negative regulator SeqA [Proteus]EST59348.1 replication initiation regulator SeqA [Proteus hauseri ZMd44]MBG6031540.1 replication initiation negative regulator SeqA [Proteus hauseri]MBS6211530.1 replication initiation negative regulator SeqA [Proteus hauseri]MEB6856996.1 replication initiation negative regulator SeqA [Proteus cibi]MEB7087010.1 replication initiation negative regulator SeqA [Proteus cibi]
MKKIEIDDELYRYIASETRHIGESASDILRRLLKLDAKQPVQPVVVTESVQASVIKQEAEPKSITPAKNPIREMRELLLSDSYAEKTKSVDRFLQILSTLYSLDSATFTQSAETVHGRTRIYFAGDEQTLLDSGRHTKPRHISGTPFWVITNSNTERKRTMVQSIMQDMQFPANEIDKVCGTI